jgi:type I restriction enzyme, S subunit
MSPTSPGKASKITGDQVASDQPEGWTLADLQDVTVPVPHTKPEAEPLREFRYIDISSISNQTHEIAAIKSFKGADAPSGARRPIRAGDVLFSNVRTYLRNVALVTNELRADLCSTGFTVLRPNGAIEERFLLYSVLTDAFIDAVGEFQTGTHYPAVSDQAVLAQEITLPPFAEQKRIVAKIEDLLARVSASRDHLSEAALILKRFRQAVLAAACDGRLTNGDDSDWEEVCFGDLLIESPQNGIYKPQTAYGRGIYIVRIDDFHDGVLKSLERLKRLRLSPSEVEKYRLSERDVLINRVNSIKFLGKTVVVPILNEPTVFESNMMRCRVDQSRASAKYIGLYLRSPRGSNELRRNAKHAVNQSSINQTDVCEVPVRLPILEDQKKIVRLVEALFKLADTIEIQVEIAAKRAEKLTQAILSKAFRGELVPTEAELARREGRQYETASVLLGRVQSERSVKTKPAPPPRANKSRAYESAKAKRFGLV